jgi:ubiquitin C
MSQCGLSNGHTLHVLVCPTDRLRISVDVYGERTMNLDVESWYTVADTTTGRITEAGVLA